MPDGPNYREFESTTTHAYSVKTTDDFYELKSFVKKIGSNRRVMDKKVLLDVVPPFSLLAEAKAQAGLVSESRRSRGSSVGGVLNGGGKPVCRQARKEKDIDQKMEDVQSSRGGRMTCN